MDIDVIKKPVVRTFDVSSRYAGIPEITDLMFDLSLLRIALRFQSSESPVYLTIDGVRGFRVLDEGDLLEFWNSELRAEGWLWIVEKGGWFDLESFREGFLSAVTGGYTEYLLLGQNECVSIISNKAPTIDMPRP